MESGHQLQKKEQRIKVNGQYVQVTEEVYQAIRKQNNHIRWLMRREARCTQTNFAHCHGDCEHCKRHVTGKIISLEGLNDDCLSALADETDIEDEYIRKETWRAIYRYADQTASNGAAILRLYIEYGLSFSEISSVMGIPKMTAYKRARKILNQLRTFENNFF